MSRSVRCGRGVGEDEVAEADGAQHPLHVGPLVGAVPQVEDVDGEAEVVGWRLLAGPVVGRRMALAEHEAAGADHSGIHQSFHAFF
jgi:hypothetical protein